jgi:hypothetical protein
MQKIVLFSSPGFADCELFDQTIEKHLSELDGGPVTFLIPDRGMNPELFRLAIRLYNRSGVSIKAYSAHENFKKAQKQILCDTLVREGNTCIVFQSTPKRVGIKQMIETCILYNKPYKIYKKMV